MKLQVALDELSVDDAIDLVKKIEPWVDILEVGTPMVIDRGMDGVRALAAAFPDKQVLADEKIMDGGYYEAQLGFEAGARYVTVLGVTDSLTVEACLRAANDFDGELVADMLCAPDLAERVERMDALGVHVIAVHTGADQQASGRTPLDDLRVIKAHTRSARIAVAGGINSSTVADYVALSPDILIVGSGITKAEDPVAEARAIREAIDQVV